MQGIVAGISPEIAAGIAAGIFPGISPGIPPGIPEGIVTGIFPGIVAAISPGIAAEPRAHRGPNKRNIAAQDGFHPPWHRKVPPGIPRARHIWPDVGRALPSLSARSQL